MCISTKSFTENSWKSKALDRTLKIKSLSKRIKELTASRDLWKAKYKNSIKADAVLVKEEKAAKHHYAIKYVLLMVLWQEYGKMSLRSVRHCFANLQLLFAIECKTPSHVSIRNWVCKVGYHKIEKEQKTTLNPNQEWVFIIDESVTMGSEKILLILGLPINEWSFSRSLFIADVHVMSVEAASEWKSEQIQDKLAALQVTHRVKYIVCDNGNNLKKALNLAQLAHVPDCTHVIANSLSHQYLKNEGYVSLSVGAGALRRKWYLSKKIIYTPPVQRTKARFQNIFPTIAWAITILNEWDKIEDDIKTELIFVKEQEEIIQELYVQINILDQVSKILKTKGLGHETIQQVEVLLEFLNNTPKGLLIKEEIKDYINSLLTLQEKEGVLLCCSDIIESYFGKFKNKINPHSPHGMSEFVLTIANFGTPAKQAEIKEALEKVTCQNLNNWGKKNPSISQQKREKFHKKRTKNKS